MSCIGSIGSVASVTLQWKRVISDPLNHCRQRSECHREIILSKIDNLVADDATNLAEVRARVFSLNVFPALGSKHDVSAELSHLVRCFVFRRLQAIKQLIMNSES